MISSSMLEKHLQEYIQSDRYVQKERKSFCIRYNFETIIKSKLVSDDGDGVRDPRFFYSVPLHSILAFHFAF